MTSDSEKPERKLDDFVVIADIPAEMLDGLTERERACLCNQWYGREVFPEAYPRIAADDFA